MHVITYTNSYMQVTMKAVVAGDGGLMYANHFPFIGTSLSS